MKYLRLFENSNIEKYDELPNYNFIDIEENTSNDVILFLKKKFGNSTVYINDDILSVRFLDVPESFEKLYPKIYYQYNIDLVIRFIEDDEYLINFEINTVEVSNYYKFKSSIDVINYIETFISNNKEILNIYDIINRSYSNLLSNNRKIKDFIDNEKIKFD